MAASNLLDLPLEVLELVISELVPLPRPYVGSSIRAAEYVQLRLVCHTIDDIVSRCFVRSFVLDHHSNYLIDSEWTLESVTWYLRTKAFIYLHHHHQQRRTKEEGALAQICAATEALSHVLSRTGDQTKVPSMRELVDYVATAALINLTFFDLAPLLLPKSSSSIQLKEDPQLGCGGLTTSSSDIGHAELLPLLALHEDTSLMATVLTLPENKGFDINYRSELFGSPLYNAAAVGSTDTVSWLISRGADVNQTGGQWHTALQAAAAHSFSTETLSILLSAGADINLQGGSRTQTAILAAAAAEDDEAVQLLLDQPDIDLSLVDYEKEGLAHHLCRAGDAKTLRKLFNVYPQLSVNQTSNSSGTPLHCVFGRRYYEFRPKHDRIVKMLLEHGADGFVVESSTSQGAVHWALDIANEARDDEDEEVPAAAHRLLAWAKERSDDFDEW